MIPPELVSALSNSGLPTWVFIGFLAMYMLSTSKLAARIPGFLGAAARRFENRSIVAARRHEDEVAASVVHYQEEIKRLDELFKWVSNRQAEYETISSKQRAEADKRISILESENRRMAWTLHEAIRFIHILMADVRAKGGDREIPDALREYFNEEPTV